MSKRSLVLVGPTNVGKSTLFNKLSKTRKAIVCDRPGVTVDRHEYVVSDSPVGEFLIVDTGGVGPTALEHPLGKEIERAAQAAVKEADVILFIVDGTKELDVEELDIANWLRKNLDEKETPIWVIANKADSKKFSEHSFFGLGFEKVINVSAEHGEGVDEIWTSLQTQWGFAEPEVKEEVGGRVIILGRPNVGKSTLMNAILGEEKVVVSPLPGTTRDTIEVNYKRRGLTWKLYDTAGMRRPGRLEREVEWVAREKLKEAAHEADIAILLIDSVEGVTGLDASIAGMAIDMGLSLVVAFNKWDLMRGDKAEDLHYNLERTKDMKLDFLQWCPKVNMSGLSGKGVAQLLKTVDKILADRIHRVQTSKLNAIFENKIRHHSHPTGRGKAARFYYISQVGISPPNFVVFTNLEPTDIHFSYKRYIINCMRDEFGFEGTPVRISFKKTKSRRD